MGVIDALFFSPTSRGQWGRGDIVVFIEEIDTH